jgi:hypothetical protein
VLWRAARRELYDPGVTDTSRCPPAIEPAVGGADALRADAPGAARWLLFIHQIPRDPEYLRVKIGRRLQRVGAVAIKNSVYVLPASDQAVEDLQWVRREIAEGGGEASICRAEFVDGLTDAEIERLFRDARLRDLDRVAADARELLGTLPAGQPVVAEQRERVSAELRRLHRRLDAVSVIDFFRARAGSTADALVRTIEARLTPGDARGPAAAPAGVPTRVDEARGRTWVTREGIFVDRIASAWLIRRFIDPAATFRFVPPQGYRPAPGELRFDMFAAEYTHEGDRCTFETLLLRFRLDDPALAEIAEIVHDIDLRDGKFDREDAAGIERVLAGIAAAHPGDAARLERGAQLFDELYALLRQARGGGDLPGRTSTEADPPPR